MKINLIPWAVLACVSLSEACTPELLAGLTNKSQETILPVVQASAAPEAALRPPSPGMDTLPGGIRPSIEGPSKIPFASFSPRPILVSSSPLLVPQGFVPGLNVKTLIITQRLDFSPAGAPTRKRRYTLYFGHNVTDAQIDLSPVTPTLAPNGIQVFSARGDLLGQENSGPVSIYVPGNIAILEASWDGKGTMPDLTLDKLIMNTQPETSPAPVSPSATPANQVNSLPVPFNSPILLHTRSTEAKTFYMTVSRISGKNIDIVLDGPGEVIASTVKAGFLAPGSDRGLQRFESQTGGLMSFSQGQAPEDQLLLTVTVKPVKLGASSARFSVNQVHNLMDYTIRFNGNPAQFGKASNQALSDTVKDIVQEASQRIYQATEGRVRFRKIKLLIGNTINAGDPIQCRVDPVDYPHPFWREHVQFTGSTLALMELDSQWWHRTTSEAASVLAHEVFHQRFGFPDEYVDDHATSDNPFFPVTYSRSLCPHSIMASHKDNAELCWAGNHNPSHETQFFRFLNPDNKSMWELLAPQLGIAAPDHSPALVLQPLVNGSSLPNNHVSLPLEVEMIAIPDPVPLASLLPVANLPPIPFP